MKPDVAAAVATALETVLRDTGRDTKPVEPIVLLAALGLITSRFLLRHTLVV